MTTDTCETCAGSRRVCRGCGDAVQLIDHGDRHMWIDGGGTPTDCGPVVTCPDCPPIEADTATDTAALDAWLCEHLLGLKFETVPVGLVGYDHDHKPLYGGDRTRLLNEDGTPKMGMIHPGRIRQLPLPALSTTGDGRALLERAIEARGWEWSQGVEHRRSGTLYDAAIHRGGIYDSLVGESIESANVAFALACRAALKAETGT